MILAREMVAAGEAGSIVTILCDPGERYRDTYFSNEWVREQGFDLAGPMAELRRVFQRPLPDGAGAQKASSSSAIIERLPAFIERNSAETCGRIRSK